MTETTVYSPIVVYGFETEEQDFSHFEVSLRKQGTTQAVKKVTGGEKQLNGSWRLLPVTFENTVKGTTYEYRVAAFARGPVDPEYTDWYTQVAGDTTPPADPAIVANSLKTGVEFVADTAYSKPKDFQYFEWRINRGGSANLSRPDDYYQRTLDLRLAVPGTPDEYIKAWVVAVDQSFNQSSEVSTAAQIAKPNLDDDIQDGATYKRVTANEKTLASQAVNETLIFSMGSWEETDKSLDTPGPAISTSTSGYYVIKYPYFYTGNHQYLKMRGLLFIANSGDQAAAEFGIYGYDSTGDIDTGSGAIASDQVEETSNTPQVHEAVIDDLSGLTAGNMYWLAVKLFVKTSGEANLRTASIWGGRSG